jgi:hypothetical protein
LVNVDGNVSGLIVDGVSIKTRSIRAGWPWGVVIGMHTSWVRRSFSREPQCQLKSRHGYEDGHGGSTSETGAVGAGASAGQ